jgi:hypothetical protein
VVASVLQVAQFAPSGMPSRRSAEPREARSEASASRRSFWDSADGLKPSNTSPDTTIGVIVVADQLSEPGEEGGVLGLPSPAVERKTDVPVRSVKYSHLSTAPPASSPRARNRSAPSMRFHGGGAGRQKLSSTANFREAGKVVLAVPLDHRKRCSRPSTSPAAFPCGVFPDYGNKREPLAHRCVGLHMWSPETRRLPRSPPRARLGCGYTDREGSGRPDPASVRGASSGNGVRS